MIEIAALTQAFRARTMKSNFCAIGSVKTNIGHLDTAAGVAGFIKTVLALKHKMIPPSLNFEQPNPGIDFASSPFYVNTKLTEWKRSTSPRRAGVSSFGIGGTNAHVVLEEAPDRGQPSQSRPWSLLLLSAKTESALESTTANLARFLGQENHIDLTDVAYTLQTGRKIFNHRRAIVCREIDDAITSLRTLDDKRAFTLQQEFEPQPVVFMFTGQGSQYVNMGFELYRSEPVFRNQVNRCCE